MKGLAIIALGWLASATAVAMQGGPDARFEDGARVVWTARPSMMDMGDATRSLNHDNQGEWALVTCIVGENRRLLDCEVTEESSQDSQIGRAILRMTRHYRVASSDSEGQASVGRRVCLGMAWGGDYVI